MPRFSGKTVIITGSSNGIGRSAALLFAQDGANVTITGRNAERLEETRQLILKSGVSESHLNSVVADVTTSDGQNLLINNAGAGIPDATGATGTDQSIDVYHKTLQINLQAVIEMTKKVKPHLMETKGEIINISSIAGQPHGQPDFMYYALAKAALDQYTRSTAIDLIQYGIRVNSVSSGIVVSGFTDAMGMPNQASQKFYNFMAAHKECIPALVAGQPEDIANIILFLADRKLSSYIIGRSIVADGGSTLVMGCQVHDIKQMMGFVDLTNKSCPSEVVHNFMTAHKECIPKGAAGQPEDIANTISFLADRELSSYIIGQSIVADGGSTSVMGMQTHNMMDILKY